ncbi:PGAP1-domain-containing protein [Cylindrobasidium torrendii FP15055 ss-10]|uniref:GPI inositol-deacylase n=1 Tax=Cylindrobasidium torrendii FP15055 ss-10 TaxID=1314674 RepID=A0A0D7BW56_9AGAR|nr:PGAP1-domain-containing protein [Cylindrobasidium torrendii FP15055 ss-10]
MRANAVVSLVSVVSFAGLLGFYLAAINVQQTLSPQGCRMSWMSPSYILQTDFNSSWTTLAGRYSLWLYREVGWEPTELHLRQPVLFIPGNAGSSHQVRSIASSAVRQYYKSPRVLSPEFQAETLKPVDTFAVEFNEDLSAFHGPTMDAQIRYTADAVSFILSHYPVGTKIVILGHSMGGIVATSLLPSDQIAAIITMSTPHTLPPARLDARMDALYARIRRVLALDSTPILSLCGGATDIMIPSETCVLPPAKESVFRRTVFTSALEGAWTGIGHREMVWCHQVRWRVARAMLELQGLETSAARGNVLDQWLRDGTRLPALNLSTARVRFSREEYNIAEASRPLVLVKLDEPSLHLLPLTVSDHLTILVSRGRIAQIGPQDAVSLEVKVLSCQNIDNAGGVECGAVTPGAVRLIPSPVSGREFPVPKEGSAESEGTVFFEVAGSSLSGGWIAIQVEPVGKQGGWVVAQIGPEDTRQDMSTTGVAAGRSTVNLRPDAMKTTVFFPNLPQGALFVYRVVPHYSVAYKETMFPPLLAQRSGLWEIHYFPLIPYQQRKILLHSHSSGPFVDSETIGGLQFDIISSGSGPSSISLKLAWWPTLGRWASRYFTTVACFAIAVVSILLYDFWTIGEGTPASSRSVAQSLQYFHRRRLPCLLIGLSLLSFMPLPLEYFLGNTGEPWLAPLAPIILLISVGLVSTSALVLSVLLWPIQRIYPRSQIKSKKEGPSRGTIISLPLISLAVFLFIPWQVAFLGCWAVHFMTCACSTNAPTPRLVELHSADGEEMRTTAHPLPAPSTLEYNCNIHILLLLTWLLPISAPVLVVWVRTLATAGLTTPFDGDHFVLNVAPFLILVDFISHSGVEALFRKHRFEGIISSRWGFLFVAAVATIYGTRKTYMVFDAATAAIGLMVLLRVAPAYWNAVYR